MLHCCQEVVNHICRDRQEIVLDKIDILNQNTNMN